MSNPSTKRLAGPAAFAASAANLYTGAGTTTYDIIKHIHIVNTTGTPQTFSIYQSQSTGTETAGKELFVAQPIAGNATYDWYTNLKNITGTDFLVGHASATSVTFTVEGETYAV
jgi:hypothetical protein